MAASMRVPVVVVIGPTGSGKSKLALEIGKYFKGEIISVDSMQIYKGLDIVTNKVTLEETRECPHHLINYVSPLQENHTIVDFRDIAVPIIDSLLKRKKIPVLCGGTNYYMESLLWNTLISQQDASKVRSQSQNKRPIYAALPSECIRADDKKTKWQTDSNKTCEEEQQSKLSDNKTESTDQVIDTKTEETVKHVGDELGDPQLNDPELDCREPQSQCDSNVGSSNKDSEVVSSSKDSDSVSSLAGEVSEKKWQEDYEKYETSELYQRLMQVDEESARVIHFNDRRKIMGALKTFDKYDVPMSQILREQKSSEGGHIMSGQLRYPDTCILWVHSDQNVLDERTDKRVDKMMDRGMIQEMLDFHQEYNKSRMSQNKEVDYSVGIFQSIGFKEFHQYLIMNPEDRETEKGKEVLKKGVEDMKQVTRRYARKQVKWIINRLLKRYGTNRPAIYKLDSTDVSKWDENVYTLAIEILTDFMQGREPRHSPLPYVENDHKRVYEVCHFCDQTFLWESEWILHLRSKKHKSLSKKDEREREKQLGYTTKILDKVIQQEKEKQKSESSMDTCNTESEAQDMPVDLTTQKCQDVRGNDKMLS